MIPTLVPAIHDWYCPNCGKTDRTSDLRPHARMHTCPALRMMSVPMLPAGMKAKVTAHDREDYVGREQVQTDPSGRPIMSITTEHDDGRQDVRVFAPSARGGSR